MKNKYKTVKIEFNDGQRVNYVKVTKIFQHNDWNTIEIFADDEVETYAIVNLKSVKIIEISIDDNL